MARIHVFACFDDERDADLRQRLEEDAEQPGSLFELVSWSRRGPVTDAWKRSARSRIRAADEVVVICSRHAAASESMAAEIRIAEEEGVPYLLLWGRRDEMCTKPAGAKRSDGIYRWTREVFDTQLAANSRQAKKLVIPESLKRRQR